MITDRIGPNETNDSQEAEEKGRGSFVEIPIVYHKTKRKDAPIEEDTTKNEPPTEEENTGDDET